MAILYALYYISLEQVAGTIALVALYFGSLYANAFVAERDDAYKLALYIQIGW